MFSQPVSVAAAPLKHHGTGNAPELRFESNLALETSTAERPPFEITPEALSYPFIIRPTTASTSAGCLNGSIPIPTIGSDRGRAASSPAITKE
jgi:hypothetical protein